MPFVTQLDYSDNRQIKQFQLTNTQLSGTTVFGMHYSGLTSGIDLTTLTVTGTLTGITSTFSGNSGTTVVTFTDDRLNPGIASLEPFTPSTSAATQIGLGFEGKDSIIVDGNTVYTTYTGSTYDIYVTFMEETSPGIYT